jgi:hypothetical protein
MAWGGGTFLTQNKILPGAYINFVSKARASIALSERGILAAPLYLNWGKTGEVFTVSPDEFQTDSLEVFGYSYDAPEMLALREIFATGVRLLRVYRLAGQTVAAACTVNDSIIATAKYGGTRGNDITIACAVNVDDGTKWDVKTYIGADLIDEQIGVASAHCLITGLATEAPEPEVDDGSGAVRNFSQTKLVQGTIRILVNPVTIETR